MHTLYIKTKNWRNLTIVPLFVILKTVYFLYTSNISHAKNIDN